MNQIDPRTGEIPPVIFGEPTQEFYVAPSMAQEGTAATVVTARSDHRGLSAAFMQMKFPVAHGMIDNWDDMERIWSHLFTHELKVNPSQQMQRRPLLLGRFPSVTQRTTKMWM